MATIKQSPHRCPACGRPIVRLEHALRMRGGYWVHRACATYRVRQLGRRS